MLILSALSAVDERVRGLRAGGDDYLTKPFESLELTARIEVLLRRRSVPDRETMLRVGDLEVDLLKREVRRGGRTIDLLPREYRLLEYLLRHPGQVITRTMLFEEVWSYRYDQKNERHRRAHGKVAPEARRRRLAFDDPHRARLRIHPACA